MSIEVRCPYCNSVALVSSTGNYGVQIVKQGVENKEVEE